MSHRNKSNKRLSHPMWFGSESVKIGIFWLERKENMGKTKKLGELQEVERGTGFIWRVRTKARMIWTVLTNRSVVVFVPSFTAMLVRGSMDHAQIAGAILMLAESKYGAKVNVEKTLRDILE